MNITRTLKLSAVVLAVMVLTMAVYGFAAANTFSVTQAGDGEQDISGYAVSAIKYNLLVGADTDPGTIDTVTFNTVPDVTAGSTIRIKLVAAGSTWYSCTSSGAAVTCTTTGADVAGADNLRIVIAD